MYSKDVIKVRILNDRVAAALSTLRHGEIIFLGDAGMTTSPSSLSPLPERVEAVDLGAVTGVPSLEQLLPVLLEVGDIEGVVVASEMRTANPRGRKMIDEVAGPHVVYEVPYADLYKLRNRARLFVRTGEFSAHGNVALIGGYPTADVPVDVLVSTDTTA